jgi:hypothetical protein
MKAFAVIAGLVLFSIPAGAHRLDEYLQATRITIGVHQISLTLELTPGVAVAAEVLHLIDPSGNSSIPPDRGERYARRVLRELRLELDGKMQSIQLVDAAFPDREDVEQGEGTIHLKAVVQIRQLKAGAHEIFFRNEHWPKISVYLANALVPEDKTIQITRQIRDSIQREFRLDFEASSSATMAKSGT